MPSLADVFRVIQEIVRAGIIESYAIGGATAVLFYAEPARTYDLDVFVIVPSHSETLTPLSGIYAWAEAAGFPATGEHLSIHGVPVQFLPALAAITREAIASARDLD